MHQEEKISYLEMQCCRVLDYHKNKNKNISYPKGIGIGLAFAGKVLSKGF